MLRRSTPLNLRNSAKDRGWTRNSSVLPVSSVARSDLATDEEDPVTTNFTSSRRSYSEWIHLSHPVDNWTSSRNT